MIGENMVAIRVCDMCGKIAEEEFYDLDVELWSHPRGKESERKTFCGITLCPSCYEKHFASFIEKVAKLDERSYTVKEGTKVLDFNKEG